MIPGMRQLGMYPRKAFADWIRRKREPACNVLYLRAVTSYKYQLSLYKWYKTRRFEA